METSTAAQAQRWSYHAPTSLKLEVFGAGPKSISALHDPPKDPVEDSASARSAPNHAPAQVASNQDNTNQNRQAPPVSDVGCGNQNRQARLVSDRCQAPLVFLSCSRLHGAVAAHDDACMVQRRYGRRSSWRGPWQRICAAFCTAGLG